MSAHRLNDEAPAPRSRAARLSAHPRVATSARWALWITSSTLVVGGVLVLAHIGAGGAETQLPVAVQVGAQAAPNTATTIPVTGPGSPSSTTSTTTTTTPAIQRTTIIRPQPTITSGDDNNGPATNPHGGGDATVTTQPTTQSTTQPTTTSTDN